METGFENVEVKPFTNGFLPKNTRVLHKDGQVFFTLYDQRLPYRNNFGGLIDEQIIKCFRRGKYPETFYTQDLIKNFHGIVFVDGKSTIF